MRNHLGILWAKQWLRCLLLAVLGFVVRLPALQGEMVWDDSYLVHDNPFVKSPLLALEAFRHFLFLDSYSPHYRPVQNLSFIADYYFWNSNVYGFHLTNVLLHVGSGILLYLLVGKLLPALNSSNSTITNNSAWSIAAFLVASLWMVHPVHSAAVDYISGRADSLAFLFACSGWLLFIRARKSSSFHSKIALYAVAALSGLLALGSREIACVWFVLFWLYLLVFDREMSRRVLTISIISSLVILAIYAGLRTLPPERAIAPPSHGWPAATRAVLMFRSLGDYARLMVFPGNLHMERTVVEPENYLGNGQWRNSADVEYLSLLGLAVIATIAFAVRRSGPARGVRIFGASWFILAYLPVSNLIELNATVAEHWLYLPSVGFLIFLAGCVLDLPVHYRRMAGACAYCAVVGLGVRSVIRSGDWLTEEIFYRRTLESGGRSARVLVNLGQVYANRGEYKKAETMFQNVLRISPDYPIARNNLAEVLLREGRQQEGEDLLASTTDAAGKTRKEYPRTWIAVLNLALSRRREKKDAEALTIAEKARRDYPGVWEVIRFESELLRETQGPSAALPLVEGFARENWWHHGASLALGRLYAEKGDILRAEAAWRHASSLDVHNTEALNCIAEMRLRDNLLEQAYAAQRRAVARQPDEPRQYALLSNILDKMGRSKEARAALAKASELRTLGIAASKSG